jgi:hypothetical protein
MKIKNFFKIFSTNICNCYPVDWIFIVWYKFKNSLASLFKVIKIPALLLSLFITFPLFGASILFNPIYYNIIYTIIIGFIFNYLLYQKLKTINDEIIKNILYYILYYFIVIIIAIIIYSWFFIETVYAASPEPGEVPNLWNIQENLRNLQQEFVVKRTDFFYKKGWFDYKANDYSNYYNTLFRQVEFFSYPTGSQVVPRFNYINGQQINAIEDYCIDVIRNHDQEIQKEAGVLLKKVEELEAMDKKIHSLTHTNFDNKEYQKLNIQLLKYRTSRWQSINHPNKIFIDLTKKESEE